MTDLEPIGELRPATGNEWHHSNRLTCRACGYGFDAAADAAKSGAKPEDGSFSVCFSCGEVSVFANGPLGLSIREPTVQELAEFARDHGRVAQALHRFRAQRSDP